VSRIKQRFADLKAEGRKALVPYITAGDPDPALTVDMMHALAQAGADIIELGVPFSDPMADGPVIQQACERALAKGTTLRRVLDMVAEFRRNDAQTPVVLMGYLNPIECLGWAAFGEQAATAGVDGLLAVDLSSEEAAELTPVVRDAGLDSIFLVAPTTSEARVARICEHASGFVYYVSVKGVTGSATLDVDALADRLAWLREHTPLPLGVGFGIGTPEAAAAVSRVADAVVVGSVLVKEIARIGEDRQALCQALAAVLGDMRRAMDAVEA
jgi:tryptophan synthase alpha chain